MKTKKINNTKTKKTAGFFQKEFSDENLTIKNKLKFVSLFIIYKFTLQFKTLFNFKLLSVPKDANQRYVKHDKFIFWILVLLSIIGLGSLYSAYTFNIYKNQGLILSIFPFAFLKQILFYVFSWFLYFLILKKFNIYYLKNIGLILLIVFLGLVLLTVFAGSTNNTSAKRWLNLGLFVIQPAEIGKIVFPLILAYIMANYKVFKFRYFLNYYNLFIIVISITIIFLIFKKMPDTGTTLAYSLIFLCLFSVSNISQKTSKTLAIIILIVLALALIGIFLFPNVMTKLTTTSKFQNGRITSFLNPFTDVKGEGYQLVSSIIAIAKGSLFGHGLGNGTQKLGWLPETESDFIFANVAEEVGLFGVLVIFILFIILFIRFWKKIKNIKDNFLKMFSFGLLGGIYANIFINLGGISGTIPMSGVPLPFFSAGVTNLVITFITLALIEVAIINDNNKQNQELYYEDFSEVLKIKKKLELEKKRLKKENRKVVRLKKKSAKKLKKNKNLKIKKITKK